MVRLALAGRIPVKGGLGEWLDLFLPGRANRRFTTKQRRAVLFQLRQGALLDVAKLKPSEMI